MGCGGRGSVGRALAIAGRVEPRERFAARRRTVLLPFSLKFRRRCTARRSLLAKTGRGRRSRVVLTPRCWRQVGGGKVGPTGFDAPYPLDDGDKKPITQEHEGNR